ncbi:kinase-like domain-containing protein [Gigaspora margarita]|uniref:Kinase-like domain-containing protein n=1 Tax=Gigaspora margarita TaxID=4874 RepID=A0A8H4A1G9_GIGMA|nr:kinase-like domain-containing protein [Gigaspora margarita]
MGFADGMYQVGEFYRQGIIVEKNIDIAFEWYLKSAITEQYTSNRTKHEIFHWIPYDKFENIEEIGKGAFSTVFKTNYLNRYGSHENVAIKVVEGSNKNKEPFLKELKACHTIMVCNGLRPKLAHDTPDCYVELANQCMNSDPEKRPNISEIITKLNEWLNIIENEAESRIKKQFLESDEISKNLPMVTEKINNIYTSKPYNISEISARLSKICISKTAGVIEVPDDI